MRSNLIGEEMKQERDGKVMDVSPGIVLEDMKNLFSLIGLLEEGKYVNWKHAVECADQAAAKACHLGLWTKDGKGYIQAVHIYSTTEPDIKGTFVDRHLLETLNVKSPLYQNEREAKGPFKMEFHLARTH